VLCAGAVACGKKGPPLPPIVHVPAAVDKLTAQRVGNDIYLTVTIPTQNIDASTPADVSRIDIFGATSSSPPARTRIFEIATKVASIDVQPVTRPGQDGATTGAAGPPSQLPPQGASVTIRDALTAADLIPKDLPAVTTRTAVAAVTPTPALPFPHRYYIAVATSDRNRSGPPGTLLDVPLPPAPDPPAQVSSTYDEDAVTLAWEPAGGVVGFLFENPIPIEPAPVDELEETAPQPAAPVPVGPTMYNVYRESPQPSSGPVAPTAEIVAMPIPLNAAPIAGLSYVDLPLSEFGRERCYTVRAVRGTPPNVVLSAPSERHCVTPEDRFAPAAPTGLNSIAAEGVISLFWEPNGEADLAGYLILRGRPGDATLQPLTETPVKDVRYEDREVMAGVRYVYAIRAVDTHTPEPNVSDESNRVEETAR
jgi:hypothetical protein